MKIVSMHDHMITQSPTIKINAVYILVHVRKLRMRLKL